MDILEYITEKIWYNFMQFCTLYGHFGIFCGILVYSPGLVCCTKKNKATLIYENDVMLLICK
jgi:hypothetical protein